MGVLEAPAGHAQLSAILVEAMAGTDLSTEAGRMLQGILLDREREYCERAAAFKTLALAGVLGDEDGLVLRLLDMGDSVSRAAGVRDARGRRHQRSARAHAGGGQPAGGCGSFRWTARTLRRDRGRRSMTVLSATSTTLAGWRWSSSSRPARRP